MTDDAGKTLTSVAPGSYQILVTSPVPFAAVDLAGINDMTACKGFAQFALSGPGVSVTTTMDNGDSDNAVLYATFAPSSTYTAVDNIQPAVAHFSFTTTAAGTPAPPSVATTAATTTTTGEGSDRRGREQPPLVATAAGGEQSRPGHARRDGQRHRCGRPHRQGQGSDDAPRRPVHDRRRRREPPDRLRRPADARRDDLAQHGRLHRQADEVDRFHEGAVELLRLDGRGEDLVHRPLVSAATAAG